MKAKPPRRVVIDTNVWLSAALTRTGIAATLCRLLIGGDFQPVFSPDTFDELSSRLLSPKFDRFLGIDTRQRFLAHATDNTLWCSVPASANLQGWCRNPDDDEFVALALAARATRLITGDDDLLSLDPLGELRILTPRHALDELTSGVSARPR